MPTGLGLRDLPGVITPDGVWLPEQVIPGPPFLRARTPPDLVAYSEDDWGTDADKTTASFTWQTGDIFVCLGTTEGDTVTLTTPSTGGSGLSFALMSSLPTAQAGSCKGYGWLATATASSSGTISSTCGNAFGGISVWQWRGSDGVGAPSVLIDATKTVNLTRTRDGSAVCGILGDFAGAAVTGYAFTPPGVIEREVQSLGGAHYSIYSGNWPDQDAAGTASYGVIGVTSAGNFTKVAVEVFGIDNPALLDETPTFHMLSQLGGYF